MAAAWNDFSGLWVLRHDLRIGRPSPSGMGIDRSAETVSLKYRSVGRTTLKKSSQLTRDISGEITFSDERPRPLFAE